MEAMRSLERMPQRFPFFEEAYIPTNKYHKMFVAKWYFVLYQIQDDTVYVDYILDCRKDYSWFIRENRISNTQIVTSQQVAFFCTQKGGAMIGSQDKYGNP